MSVKYLSLEIISQSFQIYCAYFQLVSVQVDRVSEVVSLLVLFPIWPNQRHKKWVFTASLLDSQDQKVSFLSPGHHANLVIKDVFTNTIAIVDCYASAKTLINELL